MNSPNSKVSARAFFEVAFIFLLALAARTFAEPATMVHQGLLTSPGGAPLDTVVSMTFRLYHDVASPAAFWTESQTVTVTDGLYNVALGTITPFESGFSTDGTLWLGVQAGADAEMLPRVQLRSVPFSFRVGTVDDASGGSIATKITVGPANSNDGEQSNVLGAFSHADGAYSFASGLSDYAEGDYSVCMGHGNQAAGYHSTVSGGQFNVASGNYSVIAGGGDTDTLDGNRAEGNLSVIGGGYRNNATGDAACIAGGYYHTASGGSATIGGGYRNTSTASYSTVGGGTYNDATGLYSTIAGGRQNDAAGSRSTIGGGDINSIYSVSEYSTIAGGRDNHIEGDFSTIAGGDSNAIWGPSNYATIGGGRINNIYDGCVYSTIPGGYNNEVLGNYSAIGGGEDNRVSGDRSFACGSRTNVTANNAFVFGDGAESFGIGMGNTANFLVTNGFRIWTDSLYLNHGVRVVGGGTSWITLCDSTAKTNRAPVHGNDVLDKLSAMPIDQWNYKHQPDGPKHYGPMAQDFWNAFHLGTDSLGIETLDADGVLFAAVKALISENQVLEARVKHLEAALLQFGLNETTKFK